MSLLLNFLEVKRDFKCLKTAIGYNRSLENGEKEKTKSTS